MADEEREAIVSKRVAERVQGLRKKRGLTQHDLAEALKEQGWPTDRSTVVRLESGKRGISVDDLVALAAALNVSPGWLLLPPTSGDEVVPIIGSVTAPAWAAWQWVDGLYPLPSRSSDEEYNSPEEMQMFLLGRPEDMRAREQHPATRAARDLAQRVQRVLHHAGRPKQKGDLGMETTMTAARRALDRVVAELDDLQSPAASPSAGRRS